MDAVTVQALGSIAGVAIVVLAIVQVLKPALAWPQATQDRFMPLIAVLLGVVVGLVGTAVLGGLSGVSVAQALLNGLFGGLSAVGLYSTVKPVVS